MAAEFSDADRAQIHAEFDRMLNLQERRAVPTDFNRVQQSHARPLTWDYAVRISRKPPWDNDMALCTCRNGHSTRMVSTVHTIAADGVVNPSYVCPVGGCSFHEWVRLVGWNPAHVFEYSPEAEP